MAWQAQNSFTGGEVSPRLYGRNDLDQYRNSVALLENFTIHPHGGVSRRPGTKFTAEVKDSTKATRVIPFEASTENSYCIEVGDQYMRFVKDGVQIENAGSPVELATSYLEAELFELQFAQIADTMWIVHKDHKPRRLTRSSDISWAITDETFVDGPYLPLNATTTTLVGSAATGSITVTASSTTGINDGVGFQSGDVGRMIRASDGSAWSWAEITAVTDTLNVTATVYDGNFPTSATDVWRFGKWSETTGWPSVVTFYEQRIAYAGSPYAQQDVDLSETDNYSSFRSTESDGTVVDSNALSFTVAADRLNKVQWMLPARGLDIGTSGGEWVLSGGGDPLTPTSVRAVRHTNVGGEAIQPVHVSNVALYVARGGRAVHEYAYVFEDDGYRSPDLNLLTNHLLRGTSVVDLDYSSRASIAWAVRDDGVLLGLTYMREEGVLGWHRHTTDGTFESVCTVPEGHRDTPYFVVQRTVDGNQVRYIEYLEDEWNGTTMEDTYFVDAGISYDGASTTTITGLDHLEGEAVDILADGMVVVGKTVSGGQVELDHAVEKAQVGLGFVSNLESLPIENASLEDGTSMGRTKTATQIVAKVTDSYGGKAGPDEDSLDEFIWNEDLVYGQPPEPFSGEKGLKISKTHATDQRFYIRQDLPLPLTINAVVIEYRTTQR